MSSALSASGSEHSTEIPDEILAEVDSWLVDPRRQRARRGLVRVDRGGDGPRTVTGGFGPFAPPARP